MNWIKEKLKWFFIGSTVLAASVGAVMTDAQINPYIERLDRYDMQMKGEMVRLTKARPEMILDKWGGEISMSIRREGNFSQGNRGFLTNKIFWQNGTEEVRAYPIDDENFEFEVVLNSPPQSNVIDFTIEGAENLDFFYQPELTQAEIDEGAFRPENVIGSYAVYHKTKRDHILGQTNYKTGKAFHIYRPKIIDNSGDWIWGVLDYSNGTLSITMDENWKNNADYPVTVDPTFGYTTIAGTSINLLSGEVRVALFNTPINTNTINSITLYSSTAGTYKGILYLHSDLTLVTNGVGDEVNSNSAAEWDTSNFSTNPSVIAGTDYLIGGVGSGTVTMRYDSGDTDQAHYDNGITYASPEDLTSPIHDPRVYSVYATYTLIAPTIADFSHYQTITICGDGGGLGCMATTTTNGYVILATTTQATLAATSSSGRIEKTVYDSANNIEKPLDLIFTNDAGTLLDFEIESYSTTTGQLVAWVEVDDISSTTSKTLRMYYGNASATGYQNPQDTYNSTYSGVWHLPENPSGSAPQMLDSTGNNKDGISSGGMATSDQVAGQVDGSLDFDGANDYIAVGTISDFISNSLGTFSVWVRPTGTSPTASQYWDGDGILADPDGGDGGYVVISRAVISGNDRIWVANYDGSPDRIGITYNADEWTHIVWKHEGGVLYAYKNGALVSSTASGNSIQVDGNMRFGSEVYGGANGYHEGTIDEFRAYNIGLDAMDILSNYNMEVDNTTFLTFGSEVSSSNSRPTITSVTDSPDPIDYGNVLNFSTDWNDTDTEGVKMYVCNTNATSTSGCGATTYCSQTASFSTDDPMTCDYTTISGDEGTLTAYTFVCDDEGDDTACSDTTTTTTTVNAPTPAVVTPPRIKIF